MKKVLILFGLALGLFACSESENLNNSGSNDPFNHVFGNGSVLIHGIVAGTHHPLQTKTEKQFASVSSGLSDAARVLVYNRSISDLVNLKDSLFAYKGEAGIGLSFLFLDKDNRYLGNLSAQGLSVFPLGNLIHGDTTGIDLSMLTLVGSTVVPAHDPLGAEIDISSDEIGSLKAMSGFFESLARNIDINSDNVPDVLDKKQVFLYTHYMLFHCGQCGDDQHLPVVNDSTGLGVNYNIYLRSGKNLSFNDSCTFYGPVDQPYTRIHASFQIDSANGGGIYGQIFRFTDDFVGNGDPSDQTRLPFRKGLYRLNIDTMQCLLGYSNTNFVNNVVLPVPVVHTNQAGELTSISFTYRLPDGRVVEPKNLITYVYAQFVNKRTGVTYNVHQKDDNNNVFLTRQTGFEAIENHEAFVLPEEWGLLIGYEDLVGNVYDCVWAMPQ